MKFSLDETIQILRRTPDVLMVLLESMSDEWLNQNEGSGTWSPIDIVGHLIHGEKTDWLPRLDIILGPGELKKFEAFDRFAQMKNEPISINAALDEFKRLRIENLGKLQALKLSDADFMKTGIHPDFGEVSVAQLLSAWAVHDLGHIAQISRVLAKQYSDAVGPWSEYLPVLSR